MFGFTNIGNRSDHAIAAFLRKYKAIDNWIQRGYSNHWYTSDKTVVLVAFYYADRATVYWVRDELAEEAQRLALPGGVS